MEKRLLVAITLCLGVLVGWSWLSAKLWPAPVRPPKPPVVAGTAAPAPQNGGAEPGLPPKEPGPPAENEHVEVEVSSERLDAVIASWGGGVLRDVRVWGCRHHAPRDRSVSGDPGVV